jgi:hypothetical protein
MDTFAVVLEYCGGQRTDRLVERLQLWNPSRTINVLDNASRHSCSRYVTHRNEVNTGVGGGIRDCVALAQRAGARRMLFIVNDVKCLTPLRFDALESIMDGDPSIVHASAAISLDTAQASEFPWMIARGRPATRAVCHADILVSLLDLVFISSFGGFPESKGGWGYSWELAYHAQQASKRVVVDDGTVVRHVGVVEDDHAAAVRAQRAAEVTQVYQTKYGEIPWLEFKNAAQRSHRRCAE